MGCGTAHLCPHVEARGGSYTGVDYSEQLIAENRRRFPHARFHTLDAPMTEQFDLVVSLYTVEHVADPPAYLDQMWAHCRPGGLLAVICPEFVNCPAFAPSIFFGRTPRRFREKVKAFDVVDAGWHLIDLKVLGVLWQRRARKSPPGAFWINLRPRVLHGAEFTSDTEAIHLVRLSDLVWFFEQKGADMLATSLTVPKVAPEVLRYNCYVVAKRPEHG
jgi:SAM-dependent methyltransferase